MTIRLRGGCHENPPATIVAPAIAILLTSPSIFAHHSFQGEFDNSVAVTIQGVVASVEIVNPHSFIYLDVTTDGAVERWALEGPGPLQIGRRGLSATFIKTGDELGVCGYLARHDVAGTRIDPATSRPTRKLQAAVLFMADGEKVLWSNYRQQKCGLDK